MKRAVGLFMAVGIAVFLLLALSVSVSAAEVVASGYCGGEGDGKNLTWTLDSDGVLTISGSGAMGNGDNYGSQPWTKYQDNIKKAVVSEGVTTLGEDALINCSHLTDVMLPESLTEIGDYAFFCCENLKELTIPRSVTKIGHRVNANVFTHCDSLVRIDADSLNPVFSSEDGVLFNKDKTELFCFPPGRTGRYTIPEGVTRIGKEAFSLRCKLTRVTIPDGVTSIGAYAFWGCCLTAIKLPDSVTSIGDAAFDQCGFLSNIAIPRGVTKIGEEAFGGCGRFTYVSIPANVAVIEDYTFAWCKNLTVVAIPGTVTVIGDCAFDSCDRLSDVYYSGSKEEWDRIVIGECNSPLRSVAIHYNSAAPAPSGTLVDLSTGETVMWALNDELSAVSVTGALSPSAPVFVASYDENGKMLSATCLTKPATVDLSDGDTARLFWLNVGTGVPKSDCAELAL